MNLEDCIKDLKDAEKMLTDQINEIAFRRGSIRLAIKQYEERINRIKKANIKANRKGDI